MKKILVALDYSKASKSAFEYALLLAKDLKAELTLLNVVLPITDTGEYPREIIEFAKQNEAERATTLLKKLTTYYPNRDGQEFVAHNVSINYQVQEGAFAPTIIRTAEALESDLIIIGAKSGNRLTKILLGSTPNELIRHTTLPTLVIPEGFRYTPIESIAFATALNGKDEAALLWVRQLASTLGAQVNPFFISELPYDISADLEDVWESRSLPPDREQLATVQVIRQTNFKEGVSHYLEKHPANILAMFVPKRNFLQQFFHISKTQQMVIDSSIPLLIYHA